MWGTGTRRHPDSTDAMSADALQVEREASGPSAGVVTVWLDQPGSSVVVLDLALIQRLGRTLRDLPRDARGLVLASRSERVFVAGADLKTIQAQADDELARYLALGSEVFGLIPKLPYPSVAAINGAALGGGFELAMHCDGLVAAPGAKPYPVGLPEAGLAICPGWGGTGLFPARIDPAEAIRRTATGKPMKFDEAVEAGAFDAVANSADELLACARSWVIDQPPPRRDGAPLRWIGRPDRAPAVLEALGRVKGELETTGSASAVFDAIDAGLTGSWDELLACEQQHLVRLRHEPAGRAAIEAFFARAKA